MGIIRTLMAISVLITHTEPLFGVRLLNGDMAITCFFVISGFLMALILDTRYSILRVFYENRLLRIYPPYFFSFLFATMVYFFLSDPSHDPMGVLSLLWVNWDVLGLVWAAVSNLTLIGIDYIRYAGLSDGTLVFPVFLNEGAAGGHNLLLIPQAWTLALELQYYLLAPVFMRLRTISLVVVCALSLGLNIGLSLLAHGAGLKVDLMPFFPAQLTYFLMGALAYRLYRALHTDGVPHSLLRIGGVVAVPVCLALVVFGYDLVNALGSYVKREADIFYIAFASTIPFLFYCTKNWKIDQRIGDYSYPIYLFHLAVVATLEGVVPQAMRGEATLLVTLALCAVYIQVIDRPLQAYRRRVQQRYDTGAGAKRRDDPRTDP